MAENRATKGRPGRRRSVDLKQLYETAARHFNSRGFHGTSLADLAAELGVTKAALYYYVADKQDLLYRLHTISLEAARDSLSRATEEGNSGLEKVRLVVYYFIAAITESQTACMILQESGALKPEHASEIVSGSREVEHRLRDLVAEGIADGSIISSDPKLAAFVLVGSMHWVARWYRPNGMWTGHQIADGISAMVARGLSTNPAPALPADIAKPALTAFSQDGLWDPGADEGQRSN